MDLEESGLSERIWGANPETLGEESRTFRGFFQNLFTICTWKIQRPHSPLSCRRRSLEGDGPFIRLTHFYSVPVMCLPVFQVLGMQHEEKNE